MQMIRSGDNRKTQLLSQLDQKIFFSELDNQTFEQSIVRNAELGFKFSRTESMMQAEDTSQKTSHHQQSIVDQQRCQTAYWKEVESIWNKKRISNEEIVAEFLLLGEK